MVGKLPVGGLRVKENESETKEEGAVDFHTFIRAAMSTGKPPAKKAKAKKRKAPKGGK